MKGYNLLFILFMVALKCEADEDPTTVNYSILDNDTNSEVFNASTTVGKILDFNSSSEATVFGNTIIHATDSNVGEDKKKDLGYPIPGKLEQGTRNLKNLIGSLIKELTQPNKTGLKEDVDVGADYEVATTVNYSTFENVTFNKVINASTAEAPEYIFDKSTQHHRVVENTLINATNTNAVNPFDKKEFGKLPIPRRLPEHKGIRIVTNIISSLIYGIVQLNEPDSEDDIEADDMEATIVNCSVVENVTSTDVFNTSTTEEPDKDNGIINPPVVANTLITATNNNANSPFKKIEFGKLPIPRRSPKHKRIRLVTNITGSLMKGIAQLNEPDTSEDTDVDEPTIINNPTVDNVTSVQVFNASTTEASDNCISNPPVVASTLINATNADAVSPFKKKEFGKLPIPRSLPQQVRIRVFTNIIGSLVKGIAQLNEPDSSEDTEDDEPTSINSPTVDNVTSNEVSNASTTEVFDNCTNNPPVVANTLINATNINAVNAFKKKEFGHLPIASRSPQYKGIWLVTNITGSLMKGIAQLNEPDTSEDTDIDEPTIINNPTVDNVTSIQVFNASTTEASDNCISNFPVVASTLINATNADAVSPFKKKEFGKLPIPRSLPQHVRIRVVTDIIGSLVKGIAQLNEPDSSEDTEDDEPTSINSPTVDNVTSNEVSNASTTEVFDNCTNNPPVVANTLINATNINAVNAFKKKEFGLLPIASRSPQYKGIWIVTNITWSLMKGLVQLNEPDSNDDTEDDAPTTFNNPTVEDVTSTKFYIATTTEGTENSTSGPSGTENILINATNVNAANAGGPFKKKDFGKLAIPIRLPQEGTRIGKNVIGRFVKGFVQETDSTKDVD